MLHETQLCASLSLHLLICAKLRSSLFAKVKKRFYQTLFRVKGLGFTIPAFIGLNKANVSAFVMSLQPRHDKPLLSSYARNIEVMALAAGLKR